jgi:hypothetical protein
MTKPTEEVIRIRRETLAKYGHPELPDEEQFEPNYHSSQPDGFPDGEGEYMGEIAVDSTGEDVCNLCWQHVCRCQEVFDSEEDPDGEGEWVKIHDTTNMCCAACLGPVEYIDPDRAKCKLCGAITDVYECIKVYELANGCGEDPCICLEPPGLVGADPQCVIHGSVVDPRLDQNQRYEAIQEAAKWIYQVLETHPLGDSVVDQAIKDIKYKLWWVSTTGQGMEDIT